MSIIIFSSLLSVRLFSRGEMNRAREREREGVVAKKKGKEKKRRKRRRKPRDLSREEQYSAQMDTNEVIGPGRSITACLLDFFPPPLSTFLAHRPFASPSFLPSRGKARGGRKKGRVARNKTHPSIHPSRSACSVDKQAPNNVMNLSLPRSLSTMAEHRCAKQ